MAESALASVYRRHRNASFTRFGEEGLLVVPHRALQVVLNGVGARVFELIDGVRPLEEIAAAVASEYDGAPPPEQVLADVRELVADLAGKGAIEPIGDGAEETP